MAPISLGSVPAVGRAPPSPVLLKLVLGSAGNALPCGGRTMPAEQQSWACGVLLAMTPNSRNQSTPPSTPYRWTSLFEVALGVLLVLGHNVFTVVPNEVFFLFALFWVSFKVRDGGWGVAGLKRPSSWRRTWVLAVVGVVVLQAGRRRHADDVEHCVQSVEG
jgi:hypothetical protein